MCRLRQRFPSKPCDRSPCFELPKCEFKENETFETILDVAYKDQDTVAQHLEDVFVASRFFHNRQSGYYVEMGGLNGKTFSNTFMLQAVFNWTGLLIEPNTVMFQDLLVNRPKDLALNAAVCSQRQTVHFITDLGVNAGAVGGIVEFMATDFIVKWHNRLLDHDGNLVTSELNKIPEVECVPLWSILETTDIRHIDFFSLDVEGAELEVLNSFPFDTVIVSIWCVELDGHNEEKDRAVHSLLESNNYEVIERKGSNVWFKHNKFVPWTNEK